MSFDRLTRWMNPLPRDILAGGTSRLTARLLPHLALWSLVAGLLLPSVSTGEFWWTDEARHAMGGVFMLDFVRDLPLSDPLGYAFRYFAQYPALAFNWYLPGFYVVEAVVFSVFGAAESVARLTVFAFCILGASVWFAWLRRCWGPAVAFLATALWVSPPLWNLWSRSVMLDPPVIALIIVSVWAFQRYLDVPTRARSFQAGLTLAAALLVKQTAGFILPALLLYALLTPRRAALWRWQAMPGYLIVAVALAAVASHAIKFGSQGLSGVLGNTGIEAGGTAASLWSVDRWLLYPRTLLQTWGPYLTLVSVAGALLPKREDEPYLPMIYAWVVCWYVAVTLLIGAPNAPRYTVYAFPALGLLAARPVHLLRNTIWPRAVAVGLLALAIGVNVWRARDEPIPHVSGYRDAAVFLHDAGTRGPILFAGKHDGNFIFHLRLLDAGRRQVVLRADKVLLSLAVHKYYGTRSYVDSVESVRALIARYGVQYVVLESPDILGLKEFAMLGDLVRGPAFEKVQVFPVESAGEAVAPERIEIFRYRDFHPTEGAEIVIPLPHMGREIRLKTQ